MSGLWGFQGYSWGCCFQFHRADSYFYEHGLCWKLVVLYGCTLLDTIRWDGIVEIERSGYNRIWVVYWCDRIVQLCRWFEFVFWTLLAKFTNGCNKLMDRNHLRQYLHVKCEWSLEVKAWVKSVFGVSSENNSTRAVFRCWDEPSNRKFVRDSESSCKAIWYLKSKYSR